MTRFQARFCFLGFIGLFTAISVNAIYLQDGGENKRVGRQHNVLTAALPPKKLEKKQKIAKKTHNSGRTIPVANAPSRGLVRAIQRELSARKYVPGSADGIAGILTRAAIMAYEHDQGFALTGEPKEELLKRLLLGPSHKSRRKKRPNSLQAIHMTKAVQQVLASLGYAPGEIDGMAGRETKKAIRSFEKDRGLPQTGRISGRLVREIRRVTGEDLSIS